MAAGIDLKPIYADIEAKLAELTAARQTPEVQQAIESLRVAQEQVAAACPVGMLVAIA